MMLNTKSRYAVMAMVDIAQQAQNVPVTLADMAERQEIPLAYLEQIFTRLRRAGLVQSRRGPGGGYLLARPLSGIRVADIIGAVDESLKMTRCGGRHTNGCMSDKARCLTHDLWEGLEEKIHEYLHSVSLEDVVRRQVRDKREAVNGQVAPTRLTERPDTHCTGEGNHYAT